MPLPSGARFVFGGEPGPDFSDLLRSGSSATRRRRPGRVRDVLLVFSDITIVSWADLDRPRTPGSPALSDGTMLERLRAFAGGERPAPADSDTTGTPHHRPNGRPR